MEKMTARKSRQLIEDYLANPELRYVVYNIRRRDFILHDYYRFFYRFSRREAVWNYPVVNIADIVQETQTQEEMTEALKEYTNNLVADILSGKMKKPFSEEDCYDLLHYYFNGKCYLAYYDSYLGRVVLIKERDKSFDFLEAVGDRYFLIGDLHQIIQQELGISQATLLSILTDFMETYKPIFEINHINEVISALHPYIVERISELEKYIARIQK